MRIFLSYPRKDTEKAHQLHDALVKGGHVVWRDDQLITGQTWRTQLETQIKEADALALALTPNWIASPYCNWEFITAVENDKKVIPVLLEKASLPDPIRQYQYADLSSGFDEAAVRKLLNDLHQLAVTVENTVITNMNKEHFAMSIDQDNEQGNNVSVSGNNNTVAGGNVDNRNQTFNIAGSVSGGNVNIGGTQTFHGNVNIQHGALPAAPSGSPLDELKTQLAELEAALKQESTSEETVELVQEYANDIAQEAAKPTPRKVKLQISGDGLMKAAQNLLKVSPIAAKIAQTLLRIG